MAMRRRPQPPYLDDEQAMVAERDRMVELRVKFSVEGMQWVLTNKTKNVRDGPPRRS